MGISNKPIGWEEWVSCVITAYIDAFVERGLKYQLGNWEFLRLHAILRIILRIKSGGNNL